MDRPVSICRRRIIMPHEHNFATRVTDKLEDLIGLIFLPIVSPAFGLHGSSRPIRLERD